MNAKKKVMGTAIHSNGAIILFVFIMKWWMQISSAAVVDSLGMKIFKRLSFISELFVLERVGGLSIHLNGHRIIPLDQSSGLNTTEFEQRCNRP